MPPRIADTTSTATTRNSPRRSGFILPSPKQVPCAVEHSPADLRRANSAYVSRSMATYIGPALERADQKPRKPPCPADGAKLQVFAWDRECRLTRLNGCLYDANWAQNDNDNP